MKVIPAHLKGYFKIARHYKWALEKVFMEYKFQSVILTEDDLNISPDFFGYFDSMQKILAKDPTLYCVSAWNDNGKSRLINTNSPGRAIDWDFFSSLIYYDLIHL